MEGNIIGQKSYIDDNSIIGDSLSTSSGSRRRSYQSGTRKERQKKRHGSKVKRLKWWDEKTAKPEIEQSNLPTHPPLRPLVAQTDTMTRFSSQIRGVPIGVVSDLQVFVSQLSNMALCEKQIILL